MKRFLVIALVATVGLVYAGTADGVFQSTDGAASWDSFSDGLTTLFVTALVVDPSNPAIVHAGTAGGGVFSINQTCLGDCLGDALVVLEGVAEAIHKLQFLEILLVQTDGVPLAPRLEQLGRNDLPLAEVGVGRCGGMVYVLLYIYI